MRKPNVIEAIPSLPEGYEDYLPIILKIVQWIVDNHEANFISLEEWLAQEYAINQTTAKGYVQTTLRLLLIRGSKGGRLRLTQLGVDLIESELEQQQQMLAEQFMSRCVGAPQVLELFSQSREPVHLRDATATFHQRITTSIDTIQLENRVLWLVSLGCLQPTQRQTYQITEFGERVLNTDYGEATWPEFSSSEEIVPQDFNHRTKTDTLVARLTKELVEAATDSQTPRRMELAVAEAFRFLGFHVSHLGKPGEGDVLVCADIGAYSYRVVADAKSRRDGKVQTLDVFTLNQHRQKENAQYVVVIAKSFAGGKLVRHAVENNILLMNVWILVRWLQFHSTFPLSLSDYHSVFSESGLLYEFPVELKLIAEGRKHSIQLLTDMIETLQESYRHGFNASLLPSQLLPMLVMRQKSVMYSDAEIQQALALLSYPAINGLIADERGGVNLVVNRSTLAQVLRSVADQVDMLAEEI